MTGQTRAGPKQPSAIRQMARQAKRQALDLGCHATARLITALPNRRILVVLGMRRSGNHALINWLMAQTPGPVAFYNNIRQNLPPQTAVMKEFRLRRDRTAPTLILSYEDISPAAALAGPLEPFLAREVDARGARLTFVPILRDPLNLFASRLTKWPERFEGPEAVAAQQDLYKTYARCALDRASLRGDAPVVPVLYNELVGSGAYRRDLAAALDITPGDGGLDSVPVYGHGSTFDGTGLSAADLQARTMQRWKSKEDDPVFRQVLADPELRTLAERLFGPISLELPV